MQEYIAAHLDRDLRLSDLASAAGMSSHYFAELFRRSMGIGPHRFPDDVANAYHAPQSVNYVTSHDRFTLWDLLSYSAKQNMANGHGNTDGPGDIGNWNCGFEGNDGAPAEVIALRNRQAKNLLGLLLLANGTPMLQAGHEFLQTQGGNNNPYNQDSKAHPSLCRSRFWREDITWHGVGPDADLSPESRSLAFHLRGASQGDDDLYVMVNAYWEALTFTVQDGAPVEWRCIVDTSRESPDDFRELSRAAPLTSAPYVVGPRSLVVLQRPRLASLPGPVPWMRVGRTARRTGAT